MMIREAKVAVGDVVIDVAATGAVGVVEKDVVEDAVEGALVEEEESELTT
jgi:hypothetical protein